MTPAETAGRVGARILDALDAGMAPVPVRPDTGPAARFGLDDWAAAALSGAHAAVAALAGRKRRLGTGLVSAACAAAWQGGGGVAVFACADGHVAVATPSTADRDDFDRLTESDAAGWLAPQTRAQACAVLQAWRLPAGPVLRREELADDPQRRARGAGGPFRITPGGGTAPRPVRAHAPLAGRRVLDLGAVWAGPWCGRLLAGLGAEVIKLEAPHRPDGTRARPQTFGALNAGKASLVLDLADPAGRRAFLRLVAGADVLVENFSPRVMPNLGLAWDTLSAVNPGLVMVSMPAFGATGPWAGHVAYGPVLELASGLACRAPDGRPAATPMPWLDHYAGACAAAAVLARLRRGGGAHVEMAQRETALLLTDLFPALRPAVPPSPPLRPRRVPPGPGFGAHNAALLGTGA